MTTSIESFRLVLVPLLFSCLFFFSTSPPAKAGEYRALENVEQLRVVFDVSLSSPQGANNVFWAVRNLYQEKNVTALPKQAKPVVVFRGPAVKLVSEDLTRWTEKDRELVRSFHETIETMRDEGVVFEICQYAMRKAGVNPDTVLKAVDQVGNGFVSIAGYQMQGYGVITLQ